MHDGTDRRTGGDVQWRKAIRCQGAAMTMNPHTNATELRQTTRRASITLKPDGSAAKQAKRLVAPTALLSAGFILVVSLIAKIFYE